MIKSVLWSPVAGKAWDFVSDFVTKEFYDRYRSVMASHDPSGVISLRHGDFTITGGGTASLTMAGASTVPTSVDQLRGVVSGVGGVISEVWTPTSGPRLTWTAGAGGGTLTRTDGSAWPVTTMGMTWCVPRLAYSTSSDAKRVTMVNLPDVDTVSGALVAIDRVHHAIHDGYHFVITDTDLDVDIAAPKYYSITTPNTTTRCHFHWHVDIGGSGGIAEFFENCTINVAGSALTARNSDRNSATAATLVVKYDPTSTADGTLIDQGMVGTTGGPIDQGGDIASRHEWVLLQNEDYFLKITTTANDTPVRVTLSWYEV